ncbi:hypothetical protein AVEN_200770-1 [Araneus ventricosus]|uniref:BTB domain-containing protein n=1 Tax=Araneus ventricosus TaxID=182803 RepID=A0A4Y2DW07_ARAVE|nr:hypothetical protein AVEN_200770-1 [Araneus ventricosus]
MSVPAKSFAEIFNSGYWEGMQQYMDGGLQTDEGTTFRIHRVLLSQRSRYFHALFNYNLNQETVIISNIDSKILESILQNIYTGVIALDEKNLCDLLITSDYLLLDDLLKSCESFAIQNMTSINCLPLLIVASQFNRLVIIEDCYRYALVHFEDILETSGSKLEELPLEILEKLLESKSLNVISERSVWKAIVSWTEADISTRLPQAPILLTCLRHEEVEDDLEAEILAHTIVNSNPYIFGLMLNNQSNFSTLKCAILSQYRSFEPHNQNLPYSHGPRMPNRLYLIARRTLTPAKDSIGLFLSCDNELDFWRQIGETNFLVEEMLRIGQQIYMLRMGIVQCIFDIVDEAWLERNFPPRPSSNGYFNGTTITLGEQLYYIDQGVVTLEDSRNIIFRYELENNRWEHITMILDIAINGVVTLKDQIFLVGLSKLEPVPTMICQAYDPEKDSWILLPAPNIFREEFSILVFHEKVFVIPGQKDEEEQPKKVEVYDPLQNTWILLPDLPFLYFLPRAVVMGDKIIVYENNKEDSRYQKVDPPVYWDEGVQLWQIIDESSPWYHIERYSFLFLDDCLLVKDITTKSRCPGNKWERIFPA